MVKCLEDIDMVIFCENIEDIYVGIEFKEGSEELKKLIDFLKFEFGVDKICFLEIFGIGIKLIFKEGIECLVCLVIEYVIKEGCKLLMFVYKGNIMKFIEGVFKNWGYDLCECEYGDKVFIWNEYDCIKEVEGIEVVDVK